MNTRSKLIAMLLFGIFFAVCLPAKEKHLKKSDLPPAVQRTADLQSVGASVRGYASEIEDGKLEYEVETTIGGHSRDVSIAADGTVLEIEEEVGMNALPSAVRNGLQKKAGGGTITKVESITKGGKLVAYEAQVRTDGRHSEIQVGPDGTALSHEE